MPANTKYAIMGDIHSNLEAMDAVLEDAAARDVDQFACVGDIVGYNANPIECLKKVQELKSTCVRGNHDHYCSHNEELVGFHPLAAAVISWARKQLSDDEKTWLRHLRYRKAGKSFMLVHATLDLPEKWGYVFDELDAMTHFSYQITPVCFHGHTHVPVLFDLAGGRIKTKTFTKFEIEQGHKYFINVGSVGQPRDGTPKAAYATYDTANKVIELHRVKYDIKTAQEKIRKAGLPDWLAERLEIGK